MTTVPNPGSDAALYVGCTCPVLDNRHGKSAPFGRDGWWINAGCPVHCPSRVEATLHGVSPSVTASSCRGMPSDVTPIVASDGTLSAVEPEPATPPSRTRGASRATSSTAALRTLDPQS